MDETKVEADVDVGFTKDGTDNRRVRKNARYPVSYTHLTLPTKLEV